MKGTCEKCQEKQAQGLSDYCCVLCVLAQSGLPATLHTDEHGTTMIDLSGGKND